MMQSLIKEKTIDAVIERLLDYPNEHIDEVEIRLDWDVPYIIKSRVKEEVWSPGAHVVLLKDLAADNNLMATTCERYLMENLDKIQSRALLQSLDQFTKTISGKTSPASRARSSAPRSNAGPNYSRTAFVKAMIGFGLFAFGLAVSEGAFGASRAAANPATVASTVVMAISIAELCFSWMKNAQIPQIDANSKPLDIVMI